VPIVWPGKIHGEGTGGRRVLVSVSYYATRYRTPSGSILLSGTPISIQDTYRGLSIVDKEPSMGDFIGISRQIKTIKTDFQENVQNFFSGDNLTPVPDIPRF